MPRSIRYEMPYDAPLDTVAAMLADPSFREEVCARQRVNRAEVSITAEGDGPSRTMDVHIDQWQNTTGIPSFAKKIVGTETNVIQVERWTSAAHGDITIEIPGKPGSMAGTAVLTEQGAGTLEVVELTAKVSIPLVGGKLEGLIGDLLLKALRAEHKVGRDYLSR